MRSVYRRKGGRTELPASDAQPTLVAAVQQYPSVGDVEDLLWGVAEPDAAVAVGRGGKQSCWAWLSLRVYDFGAPPRRRPSHITPWLEAEVSNFVPSPASTATATRRAST